MLELPGSVKVARNPEEEKALIEKAKDWLQAEERAPGFHASETLDPRRAYWQRLDPQPMDGRQALIFLVGKVLHSFIINAADGGKATDGLGKTDEGSYISTDLGITYSPDRIVNGIPRELKTSRAFYEPKTVGDIKMYLEQLLVYMAAEDKTDGKLEVLYLNLKDEQGRTSPAIRVYDIHVEADGLASYKKQITDTVAGIKHALAAEDHRTLPLCREFLCNEKLCAWWHKCMPEGRYDQPRVKSPTAKGPKIESPTDRAPQPGARTRRVVRGAGGAVEAGNGTDGRSEQTGPGDPTGV